MFIVSGHFDGRGGGGACDDDASGSALVLECARAFARARIATDVSIRFIFWNNEETGPAFGSIAYVQNRNRLQGVETPPGSRIYPEPTWLGMIQHDMIMFDHGLPPQPAQIPGADLDIEYQQVSLAASLSATLAATLLTGNGHHAATYPAQIGTNMANTDSSSFRQHTAAVSVRENQRIAEIGAGSNPHWHQRTDRYTAYSDADFRLGFDALRTTLGTVGEMAWARVSAAYDTIGVGCAGTLGVPSLATFGNSLPVIGSTFDLELGGLPAPGIALALTGFSNNSWGTLSLPLDLGFLGAPGCPLRVSPDVIQVLFAQGGIAAWPIQIPGVGALSGTRLFVQGVVSDPPATAGGLIVSGAGVATIGTR